LERVRLKKKGTSVQLSITPLADACRNMVKEKVGALIVIARKNNLQEYIDTGEVINAKINTRLIENIFFKNIRTIKAIQKIGENTLIYYAVHSPIVLYILNIIFEQLITRYTGIFVNNYIVIFFYLPVALILCELIARIINNTFPILLGKNKPI